MGYLDTMKVFGKLEGNDYYFNNIPTEAQIVKKLLHISKRDHQTLNKFLNLKDITTTRFLLEKTIPKLSGKIPSLKRQSYKDFYISCLEYLIKIEDKKRLVNYDYREINNQLLEKEYKDNSLESKVQLILKHFK